MDNILTYKTYLYLSEEKLAIVVLEAMHLKIIYKQEFLIKKSSREFNFEKLKEFLENNIFKIEKELKNFIKNIYIIIDNYEFFLVNLSIKNQNNGNLLSTKNLQYSLNEARDLCKKTFEKKRIIHMLIENYLIDDKFYSSLPKNLKCNNFALDIKFLCLSENLVKNLEKTLESYQISVNQIVSGNYVKSFLNDNEDLFIQTLRITQGCNPNEIRFSNKIRENQGFFEKFFNFFR
jgi:hypothetical protein